MNETASYRDYSPWPGWVAWLLWGCVFLPIVLIFTLEEEGSALFRMAMTVGLLSFGLLMKLVFGGLTVLVQETRLFIHLGMVPLIKKKVLYEDILSLRPTTYRPLREFGGWGVRGYGPKQAWTASGSKALVLSLRSGNELYVGSDDPEQLEERVLQAMGRAGASPADRHATHR